MADRMVDLTNRDLARELRQKGLDRARAFSWDNCVRRTLTLIEETALPD
jgi:glycosyltransferase involved in cell wall biosynthesis